MRVRVTVADQPYAMSAETSMHASLAMQVVRDALPFPDLLKAGRIHAGSGLPGVAGTKALLASVALD